MSGLHRSSSAPLKDGLPPQEIIDDLCRCSFLSVHLKKGSWLAYLMSGSFLLIRGSPVLLGLPNHGSTVIRLIVAFLGLKRSSISLMECTVG